jgi:hypothetical protein
MIISENGFVFSSLKTNHRKVLRGRQAIFALTLTAFSTMLNNVALSNRAACK